MTKKINYRRATIYFPCQDNEPNLDEKVGENMPTVREIVDQVEDANKAHDIGLMFAYLATIPIVYLIARYVFLPFLSWCIYGI